MKGRAAHAVTSSALACLFVVCLLVVAAPKPASAQCKPVSERTQDVGCWILATQAAGPLAEATIFWHLDTYPTRAAAESAKGPRGVVLEALGSIWLSSLQPAGWRPTGGIRVAEIGPLSVNTGAEYTAQYMEGIFRPGMTTEAHYHPGPEALYTTAGEICFETPHGKIVGRAGEGTIMQAAQPHTLTATGTDLRRSLALVLHEKSQPWRLPSLEWKPLGLCK